MSSGQPFPLSSNAPARETTLHAHGGGHLSRILRAARQVYPAATAKGFGDRLLFVLRSVVHFDAASTWYALLEDPQMAAVARANPSLYRKIIRPYLTPRCSTAEKLSFLLEHYRFMAAQLRPSALSTVCTHEGLSLLRFVAAHGDAFDLRWVSDGKNRKEGEHSLRLFSERHGVPIQSLTFLVARRADGRRMLVIGGLQGLPRGVDKSVIRDVTKSLHGLRPKAFLLFVAQQLAAAWQLEEIRAVASASHVSRHWDYRLNRARRPAIEYDEFWRESGGRDANDGFYELPVRPSARSASEVKTNKRSLYAHRYALLDSIAKGLQESLGRISSTGAGR